jgi:hypothetical protein
MPGAKFLIYAERSDNGWSGPKGDRQLPRVEIHTALTTRLVCDQAANGGSLIQQACEQLREKFGIAHATL